MKKLLYISLSILLLISCSDPEKSGVPKFTVYLEDAPADYKAVNMKLDALEIFNGTDWVALNHARSVFNILEYTAGSALKLTEHNIPNGVYSKIRFVFDPNNCKLTTFDNTTYPLLLSETDRIVELPISVEYNDDIQYVMCDMDVAKSINEQDLTFKPQISVIDLQTAGAISGIIATDKGSAIAEQYLVKVTSNTGEVKYSYTNPKNGNLFVRLYEGEYTVEIIANPSNKYLGKTIKSVTVRKAEATMLGVILMSADIDG